MAESPPPLTSQSHDFDELPILKLDMEEGDPFIQDEAPCDPVGKDHGSSSQNASIHGVEELELRESIERELLELATAQAVIEAEGKNVKDDNSVGAENEEVANSAEEDARTGTEEEVADEKSGKNGENGEEGIGDEGEVMKLGGQGQHRDHNMQRRAIYPMRPNAEDCSYYMKFGSCKFGHSCKFNHPPRRKNQVKEKPKHKEENSETGGQPECKYYLMSGGCRYGKDCKYSHGPDKTSSPNNPEFNFLGLPIRPGEKECPYYMRNGSCKYGSNCRFHHPEPKTVAGGGSPSGYGNGGSLPTQLVSAPVGFTDTPFIPVMFPPTQGGATPNVEWNGYSAVPYPTSEKGLPTPPAFAMNNMPAELSFPMQHQQRVTVLEEYPERPGEPECNFFLKTGDCKFKSNCKFHHPKNRGSHAKVNSFSLNDKGLPLRPDQPMCTHYHRYGICKYGPGCKYDHSQPAISSSPDAPSSNSKFVDGAETSEQGNEGESC